MGDIILTGLAAQIQEVLGYAAYNGHASMDSSEYDAYVAESEVINNTSSWFNFFTFRVPVRKVGKLALQVRTFNNGGSTAGTSAKIGMIVNDDTGSRVESQTAALTGYDTEHFALSMASVPVGNNKFTVQCKASSTPNSRWRAITYRFQFLEDGI